MFWFACPSSTCSCPFIYLVSPQAIFWVKNTCFSCVPFSFFCQFSFLIHHHTYTRTQQKNLVPCSPTPLFSYSSLLFGSLPYCSFGEPVNKVKTRKSKEAISRCWGKKSSSKASPLRVYAYVLCILSGPFFLEIQLAKKNKKTPYIFLYWGNLLKNWGKEKQKVAT